MATVYVNIGLQKTATTAIQYFMRENEEHLKKQGCCYPYMNLGIPSKYKNRNAQFLVYRAEDVKDLEERKMAERQVRENAYEILKELAEEYPKIVLSDELIWHRSAKNEYFWEHLVNDFAKIGCDVKIVVYLRRQDLFIQSIWNQSVKQKPWTDLTFEECINGDFFDYYPLNYYEQLCHMAKYLKKENLIVRIFEKGQFEGDEHSIFSDFLTCMGLDLTPDFTKKEVRSNLVLSGNFVEIKRILNSVHEQVMEDLVQKTICEVNERRMKEEPLPRTTMFSYEDQVKYLQKFEEGNRKVAEEFLGREDGILFYEPLEELAKWEVNQDTMYRDMLLSFGEIIFKQQKQIISMRQKTKRLEERCRKMKETEAKHQEKIKEAEAKLQEEIAEIKGKVDRMDKSLIFRSYRKLQNTFKKS